MADDPQFYEETDSDNALLLIEKNKNTLRYCHDAGCWFVWESNKWVKDSKGNFVKYKWYEIANEMPKTVYDSQKDKYVPYPWRKYSLSARGTNAVLAQAQMIRKIQVKRKDFDSSAYELNTPNGIVNLKTGIIEKATPEKLHTRETTHSPKNTKPKKWLRFLDQTFQKDKETIEYMQRLMGLTLIGQVVEQIMPFAHGHGGTGKSTFFNTIVNILNSAPDGYSGVAPSQLLTKARDSKDEKIANLQGKRMILMSEIDANAILDEALLKQLTGNDALSGKFLYESSFTFYPTHTLFLLGNTKPRASEGGSALWRRMRVLPFNNTSAKNYDNKDLQHQLVTEEGPQILNWLIQGATKYLNEGGLLDSQEIISATEKYEEDEDTLGQFIQETSLVADNAKVLYKTFRDAYVLWCQFHGYKPLSTRTLTERLKTSKKYGNIDNDYRTSKGRYLTGITLLSAEDDRSDRTVTGR